MEDIRFYRFDTGNFELLHIEHNIKSCYWTLYFNEIGTFEGTFPLSNGLVNILMNHQYLFLTQGKMLQAIITGKTVDSAVKIYGKTPNWILSRRTIGPFKTSELKFTDYPSVVQYVLQTGFSDIYESDFTFHDLPALELEGEAFWRNTRNPVSDVIRDRLENDLLGHRVVLDVTENKWNFEIYQGENRVEIVSEANRNLKNVTITDDCQNFYTAGWYKKELVDKGDWNPYDNSVPASRPSSYGWYYTITYEDEQSPKKSYPAGSYLVCADKETGTWKVCNDMPELWEYLPGDAEGICKWDAVLSSATESEAKTDLTNKIWRHEISGESSRLKLGTDYGLGDTVRVQVEKGGFAETVSKRITGAEIWWENGNVGEKLIFKEE